MSAIDQSISLSLCISLIVAQHLVNDLSGVTMNYFVVGAANFIDQSRAHAKDVPAGSLKYFWADSKVYGLVEANGTQLSLSFIDHAEQTLYQASILPRF